ncbi:MAG TPA: hypothetical protein PLI65_08585 [Bacteroidales bacterium]|nr:hypothetical protein [Bacteroidales bacterium]
MKNETNRKITRHSLPTRMCFNFFYPPHKNFEILPTHITHDLSRFVGIAKAPRLVPTLRGANA